MKTVTGNIDKMNWGIDCKDKNSNSCQFTKEITLKDGTFNNFNYKYREATINLRFDNNSLTEGTQPLKL